MLRRIILAIALLASAAPALAQVPPPVPALPDTERRTTYAITGTTCACAVNFALYGDSTDYQNWVEVYFNGVLANYNDPTFGWVITSPSGSLSTIARPITNAILTFTSTHTGTVQIVGARRPRRASQFSESRGVPARDLNQAVTDITATLREMWDKTNDVTGRSILSQPGNTIGLLPLPAACVSAYMAFDSTGLNPVCLPSVPAGVITPNSVTNAMLAAMNATTIKCNPTGSSGNAQDCTAAQIPSVLPGADLNLLNAKVANYTIANTDCGKTIQAGAGATGFFTITLPAVAGFATNCSVLVKNGDTARGKLLSGFPSDLYSILWPSQAVGVEIINGVWATKINPGPYQLNGAANTLHVNHSTGSDSNNDCLGTGSGACATIQHAGDLFQTHVLCNGQQPLIQVDDASFSENASFNGVRCAGANNLQIVGNAGTPGNAVWNAPGPAGSPGLNVSDKAIVVVNGFKLQCSVAGAINLQVNQGGLLAFMNVDFGNCSGGQHMSCAAASNLVFEGGTYTISGAAFGYHVVASACAFNPVGGQTVSVPNAMTFTQFYSLSLNSSINTNLLYSGAGAGAGSTGQKFSVTGCSSLILNGTTLPGATAGAPVAGAALTAANCAGLTP